MYLLGRYVLIMRAQTKTMQAANFYFLQTSDMNKLLVNTHIVSKPCHTETQLKWYTTNKYEKYGYTGRHNIKHKGLKEIFKKKSSFFW